MSKSLNFWSRKLHRWTAIAFCVPLLIVILSGILLQLKKHWSWIQPAAMSADHTELAISFDEILAAVAARPESGVNSWEDIDRLDVRPRDGVVKVQCANKQELQVDLRAGKILASNYRRSDLIESIHDGSFFGDWVKLGIFLPNAVMLLFLWISGIWLWYLPYSVRRNKARRKAALTG